jgi:hypothetical protein
MLGVTRIFYTNATGQPAAESVSSQDKDNLAGGQLITASRLLLRKCCASLLGLLLMSDTDLPQRVRCARGSINQLILPLEA